MIKYERGGCLLIIAKFICPIIAFIVGVAAFTPYNFLVAMLIPVIDSMIFRGTEPSKLTCFLVILFYVFLASFIMSFLIEGHIKLNEFGK
jgi:hypothetical protein